MLARSAPVAAVVSAADQVVVDAAAEDAMTGIPEVCPSKSGVISQQRLNLIDVVTTPSRVTSHGARTLATLS